MRRREFLILSGGIATGWLPVVSTKASNAPVIGYLHPFGGALARDLAAFKQGLGASGFVERQNVAIEFRNALGRPDQLTVLAAELARLQVSAIFTSGGVDPALAAKQATSTIPIVFVHGSDPVKTGLVQSIARPGANVTGVTFVTGEIQQKTLGLLREALPSATAVAALVNPRSATGERRHDDIAGAARALGMELRIIHAGSADEFAVAFETAKQAGVQAIVVVADPLFRNRLKSIVELADKWSIPLMGAGREFAEAGAFLSYGADPAASFREAGVYVGRILKGEKPADLPVLQPTKFEFVVNRRAAKALGLEIPSSLYVLADEVVD